MVKCLWCDNETDYYFCRGGGQTLAKSNTGEVAMTKSYCLNDFLTALRLSKKMEVSLTEEQKTYVLWADEIDAWYNEIPFIEEGFVKEPVPKVVEQ